MVDQGMSFTLVEAPSFEEAQAAAPSATSFRRAHRVWLGATGGTDWLHGEVERELGEDAVHYEVRSKRESFHGGASGTVELVALVLLGTFGLEYVRAFAGALAEGHAHRVLQWARERAHARRRDEGLEEADGPPDFFRRPVDGLAAGMRGELASVVDVPPERLALVRAERPEGRALRALYRDSATGQTYEVVVERDCATFEPIDDE